MDPRGNFIELLDFSALNDEGQAEVIARTPTLADWPYRLVRLACDHCPRRGQYRKETLIVRFGGDVDGTRFRDAATEA